MSHASSPIQMQDFEDVELERAAPEPLKEQHTSNADEETNEHNEPTLVIGQDVFRNRQRLLEQRRMTAIVLGAIAAVLLASTITLAVLYGKLLRHGHDAAEQPATKTTTNTVTIHHTTTAHSGPTPTPTSNSLPVLEGTTVTASTTNIAISPAAPQPTQCWPGSVWGGADLKEVNEGYGTLMAVALGTSQLGRMGIATDYELVALRSIFLCGMSMAPGELQVLDVCRAAYVSSGDGTRCDEGGSELREGKTVA